MAVKLCDVVAGLLVVVMVVIVVDPVEICVLTERGRGLSVRLWNELDEGTRNREEPMATLTVSSRN